MDLIELIQQWGLVLIFAAVLIEQLGLPLPAVPLLVAGGALASSGAMRPELILLLATVACLLADHAWFFMGRHYGRRLLALLCRISLSPDGCVSSTDRLITRHGPLVFVVAKFLPGVSAVCVPTAAATGMAYRKFVFFDGLGSLLWSGFYLSLGMIFSSEIKALLALMSQIGSSVFAVIAGLLVVYLGWRYLYRRRLQQLFRLARISADELLQLFNDEPELILIDARSASARLGDALPLPRSRDGSETLMAELMRAEHRDQTVVTFCTCPSEASAAVLAKRLRDSGYQRVRVLTGGDAAITTLRQALLQPAD